MPFLITKCTMAKRAVSFIAIFVILVVFSIHNDHVLIHRMVLHGATSLSGMTVQGQNMEEATLPHFSLNNNNVAPLRFGSEYGNDAVPTVCLTKKCFQQHGQHMARAFSRHLPKESWCIPTNKRGNKSRDQSPDQKWQGLLLVKTPKAASSTTAGIVLRIYSRQGCAIQWLHTPGKYYVQHRTEKTSLLIATVRNPTTRAVSHAWYAVFDRFDIMRLEPTDDNIIKVIQSKGNNGGGYQFKYLLDGGDRSMQSGNMSSLFSNTTVMTPDLVHARIKEIIDQYDFLLVAERMDESLTALALLTGLDIADVLVKDSKVTGHYIYIRYGYKKDECHFQQKANLTQRVGEYFESNEWLNLNYADEILWRAANASLDKTIDETLGRDRFDMALQEYKRLKQIILNACPAQDSFGCDSQGQPLPVIEKCYDRDFGCGYECIDMVLQNQTRFKTFEDGFNKSAAATFG